MRVSSAHVAHVTFIIPGLLFLRHSIANSRKHITMHFFSRSTQNHEKHEHIEHIMGYIMFRHRKLVVVLLGYIGDPHFSFDRSVP